MSETIGYGPLTEFLFLGNLDIWLTTQFLAIMFVIINLYFLIISKKHFVDCNNYYFTSISISSYSLNSDIFVLFYVLAI